MCGTYEGCTAGCHCLQEVRPGRSAARRRRVRCDGFACLSSLISRTVSGVFKEKIPARTLTLFLFDALYLKAHPEFVPCSRSMKRMKRDCGSLSNIAMASTTKTLSGTSRATSCGSTRSNFESCKVRTRKRKSNGNSNLSRFVCVVDKDNVF